MINKSNKSELYRGIGYVIISCIFLCFAISRITISMMVALALLGQNLAVSIINYCGLFNREKLDDKVIDAPGILLAVVGIILFLDSNVTLVEVIAMMVSFAFGMTSLFAMMCLIDNKHIELVLNTKNRLSYSAIIVFVAISMDIVFVSAYSKISIMSGLIIAVASLICNFSRYRYEVQKRQKIEYYNHIVEQEHKHRDYIVSKWLETINDK